MDTENKNQETVTSTEENTSVVTDNNVIKDTVNSNDSNNDENNKEENKDEVGKVSFVPANEGPIDASKLIQTDAQPKKDYLKEMEEKKEKLRLEREAKQREKDEYQPVPVSKFKYFCLIMLFVFLFAMIYFLPDLDEYIAIIKNGKANTAEPEIRNGILKCSHSRTTDKLDIKYSASFKYQDNKLESLKYVIETTGDSNLDKDELNQLYLNCTSLKSITSSISGVDIYCSLEDGTMIEEQDLSYASIDLEKITSAYAEAGGTYPDFKHKQDIKSIEKNMKATDFTCE